MLRSGGILNSGALLHYQQTNLWGDFMRSIMRPLDNIPRNTEGIILALSGTALGIWGTWEGGNDTERQNSEDSSWENNFYLPTAVDTRASSLLDNHCKQSSSFAEISFCTSLPLWPFCALEDNLPGFRSCTCSVPSVRGPHLGCCLRKALQAFWTPTILALEELNGRFSS